MKTTGTQRRRWTWSRFATNEKTAGVCGLTDTLPCACVCVRRLPENTECFNKGSAPNPSAASWTRCSAVGCSSNNSGHGFGGCTTEQKEGFLARLAKKGRRGNSSELHNQGILAGWTGSVQLTSLHQIVWLSHFTLRNFLTFWSRTS